MDPQRLETLIERHVQRRDRTLDVTPEDVGSPESEVLPAPTTLELATREWLRAVDEYWDDDHKARVWAFALKPWLDTLADCLAVAHHVNEEQRVEYVRRLSLYWSEGF